LASIVIFIDDPVVVLLCGDNDSLIYQSTSNYASRLVWHTCHPRFGRRPGLHDWPGWRNLPSHREALRSSRTVGRQLRDDDAHAGTVAGDQPTASLTSPPRFAARSLEAAEDSGGWQRGGGIIPACSRRFFPRTAPNVVRQSEPPAGR